MPKRWGNIGVFGRQHECAVRITGSLSTIAQATLVDRYCGGNYSQRRGAHLISRLSLSETMLNSGVLVSDFGEFS